MTMITPSYLGETIEYSSLHACRSTLEDPTGATQDTERQAGIAISVLAGTAATTGSEVPPTPSSGAVGLYLIDLTYGQTQITSGEILVAGPSVGLNVPSNYPQAPFIRGLLTNNPADSFSHHLGISGHAPKVSLTREVQGLLPLANILNLSLAHGECVLSYVGSTSIALTPKNGCNLLVDGVQWQVPAAGVTLSNTGLSDSTLYYIYAYINAGTLTLIASTTGHATDSTSVNLGVEIESGNSLYTLVGMVRTGSSGLFIQTLVRSWFNDLGVDAIGAGTSAFIVTSGSPVELNSPNSEVGFLAWASEIAKIRIAGHAKNGNVADTAALCYLDNSPISGGTLSLATSAGAGYDCTHNAVGFATCSEGYHAAAPFGYVSSGTGTFDVVISVEIKR